MDCQSAVIRLREILAGRKRAVATEEGLVRAAVLVPLFCKDGQLHILFTLRSGAVTYHKGQVSFPGGTCAKEDCNLLDTALRESWEEIGLKREDAGVIGELDDVVTHNTKFAITPFVGLIPYPYPFKTSPREIDRILEVPVSHLADKANWWTESRLLDGVAVPANCYRWQDTVIWGATARIVDDLLSLLPPEGGAPGQ